MSQVKWGKFTGRLANPLLPSKWMMLGRLPRLALSLTAIGILVGSLVACGGPEDTTSTRPSSVKEEQPQESASNSPILQDQAAEDASSGMASRSRQDQVAEDAPNGMPSRSRQDKVVEDVPGGISDEREAHGRTTAGGTATVAHPSAIAPALATPTPPPAAGPSYSYNLVTDDTGALVVEVPREWNDIDGALARANNGQVVGAAISASTDLRRFNEDVHSTPGVYFLASPLLAQRYDVAGLLDTIDHRNDCAYQGRTRYDDGFYEGLSDLYADCAGSGASFFAVVAVPEDQSFIVIVMVSMLRDADFDALEEILASFDVVDDLPASSPAAAQPARNVVVNEVRVSADVLAAVEQQYGLRIQDGRYWYDPVSGAFGVPGGPAVGFVMPYLPLGGPLRADASGGLTNVYVNGRALHPQDQARLQQLLGPILPGRYWLDAQGNYGREGGPALGNLSSSGSSAGGSGQSPHYRGWFPGGDVYAGGDGQNSYFYDSSTGCSVMGGELVC